MSGGYMQFGFGDNDETIGGSSKKFKLERGQEARVSFLWWKGLDKGQPDLRSESPQFAGGPRHYMKGVGFFMDQGPEFSKISGAAPKIRIVTLIVKWPMVGGKIDMAAVQAGKYEVMPWIFDEAKYETIRGIHSEFHLGESDLKIACTDATFQKMTFTPYRQSILRTISEKPEAAAIWQKIVTIGQALLPNLPNEVGRLLTIEQVREKLLAANGATGGGVSNASAGAGSQDMDDALSKLLDE